MRWGHENKYSAASKPAVIKPVLIVFLLLAATVSRAQTWQPLGPAGGDVRVLAADPARPARIFLGTADGHIFGSQDAGAQWALLGRASSRLDTVITAIVVDPRNESVLFASSWTRDAAEGGGVFRSADGGRTWTPAGLAGLAVRALAIAPSDPDVLVAGTVDGVYRSRDASRSWERISPEHDERLRNLDSLAIDRRDPQTIYAGTFHLPWKTADGGRTWRPIHAGMIDDSDVMSLLIDEEDPQRIYASSCSGIYRSDDRAAQWRKIQGVPYTARRTYAIAQDPSRPGSVYAATSEGLWKTADEGMTWRRITPESWVVNTVVIAGDTPGHVLIGTDEWGVLSSDDGGEHFRDSNAGFNHRQILALGIDPKRPGRLLAVLAHAPEPILATDDGGRTWSAVGPGLPVEGSVEQSNEQSIEQVQRVYAAPDGDWWASLARGGLLRYDAGENAWIQVGMVTGDPAQVEGTGDGFADTSARHAVSVGAPRARRRSADGKPAHGQRQLREVVADMAFSSNEWYAATSRGLLVSTDKGANWAWNPVGSLASPPVQSVRVTSDGARIRLVSAGGLIFTDDSGNSWTWHDLPLESGGALTLDASTGDPDTLIAIARKGLYISRDAGNTWQQAAAGLPSAPVRDFAAAGEMFVASLRAGGLYVSMDFGRTWVRVGGAPANGVFEAVAPAGDSGAIFAASATEGLYRLQWPRSTASTGSESKRTAAR